MVTPTTAELLNAIDVLNKLGERIDLDTAHSLMQMPESSLGEHYAGRIGVIAIEQISRIKVVAGKPQNWRNEIIQQWSQNVSQSV